MRTGFANLPLHDGKAPRWLFSRMVKLAREIVCHMVSEHGPDEVLLRLSDPYWFQALGCVLGFLKKILVTTYEAAPKVEILHGALDRAKVDRSEKVAALKRLARLSG